MRIPRESLDDFIRATAPKPEPQPPAKYVRLTGEIEVLKPLATWDGVVKPNAAAFWRGQVAWYRLSAFHRSLATGGVVALMALMLGSAVFLRTDRSPIEQVMVTGDITDQPLPTELSPTVEPDLKSDLLTADDVPSTFEAPKSQRLAINRRAVGSLRPHIPNRTFTAAIQRARHQLPNSQFWVSQFVPTTLVIFVEKGEIKTRTEPQALYKKLSSN